MELVVWPRRPLQTCRALEAVEGVGLEAVAPCSSARQALRVWTTLLMAAGGCGAEVGVL